MSEEPLVSQDEISTVLGSSDEPTVEEPKAAAPVNGPYSLRRPTLLSPAKSDVAAGKLNSLAKTLREGLEQSARKQLSLELAAFQQQKAGDSMDRLAGPVWILTFSLEEGGGLIFALDGSSALSLVELSLGGNGSQGAEGRLPTPLEGRVMKSVGKRLSVLLGKAIGSPVKAGFRCNRIPRSICATEEILGAGLLSIQSGTCEMQGLLLATMDLLRDAESDDEEEVSADLPPLLQKELREVPVELRALLKAGTVRLRDLPDLQPGKCLYLVPAEEGSWTLRANGLDILRGTVQANEKSTEFQVTETLQDGAEEANESTMEAAPNE